MNNLTIKKQTKCYHKKGTAYFAKKHSPFSKEDLALLIEYCEKVDKEFIKIGDAGEKNHLLVGRFMTDIKKPKIVKNPFSRKLLKILNRKKILLFIKKILKEKENIYIRRVQFNQIDKGCFVGYHNDKDSNPDYIAACVIQLGNNFNGGKYRVYQPGSKQFIDYIPTLGSLIVSNCNYPHEVTKVTTGRRKSLVFFVSLSNEKNKRKYS